MQCDDRIQVLDEGCDIYSVIKRITEEGNQDEAFYVCDVSELIWRYNNWKKLIPRIEPYYAVKCNESRIVLGVLAALGIGFDCASKEEIRKVLSLAVKPSKIIFANPTKKISHITYAADMGVAAMTFDNELELYKIKKHYPKADKIIFANPTKKISHTTYAADVGVAAMTFDNELELYKIKKHYPKAELVLRIKCDDVTAKYVLGNKFGANPGEETKKLLSIAKSLDLNVIGVAFHVGSGCSNYAIYLEALSAARTVFDEGRDIGYEFKFLDIGGGFPGKTSEPIDEIAKYINKGLAEFFPDTTLQIISEPGNYCVNTAFKLVSIIHSKRIITEPRRNGEKDKNTRMYYIDVGLYGALIPVLFQEFYHCHPVKSMPDSTKYPSIIWGPTCDSSDKISDGAVLIRDMEIGEWVIFEEAGGYTLSIACEFNGFPTPDIHAVVKKEDWLLLTEKVPRPLPSKKFVFGPNLDNFKTGLGNPYKFRTNYF